jgi:hypothetical protein
MKLAEALSERKAIKTRMEDLKQRLYRNAHTQEGEPPHERPEALLDELSAEVPRFAAIVARINATNAVARLPSGEPLASAILRRDMLRYLHLCCTNLADKATPVPDRYSRREIKTVPSVDVAAIRRRADEHARDARLLDLEVQEANWRVELV